MNGFGTKINALTDTAVLFFHFCFIYFFFYLHLDIYGELDVCQRKLRQKLKRFEYIYEGAAQHGNQTLLNKVYTELYITEGTSGTVNNEHEVRQIEAAMRKRATEDKPIKCEDIFKPLLGQDRFIRTVLTKGISGIGKNNLCTEV